MAYIYKFRGHFRTLARANQRRDSSFPQPTPKPDPVTEAPEIEAEDSAEPRSPGKITMASVCVCGHRRDGHCLEPMIHFLGERGDAYTCLFQHCAGSVAIPEPTADDPRRHRMEPCPCPHFQITSDIVPEMKRPKATPYTPCATCGHWRSHHCKVRRPSKKKLKFGELPPWTGFEIGNQVFQCKHTAPDAQPYLCNSASCAMSEDGQTYCFCQRYISPLARGRARVAKGKLRKETAMGLIPDADLQRAHARYLQGRTLQTKTLAEILLEAVRDYPDATTQELAEASGRSVRWVRKNLREAGIAPPKAPRQPAKTAEQMPLEIQP